MSEQQLQDLFRGTQLRPPADRIDVDAAVRRGRRRRRTRRAAALSGVLGAMVVAGSVGYAVLPGVGGSDVGTRTAQPARSSSATTAESTQAPSPETLRRSPVVVAKPGQKVFVTPDSYLTINGQQYCLRAYEVDGTAMAVTCKSLSDGNQPKGTVSTQGASAVHHPEIFTGVYTGTDAGLITVTAAGSTKVATIVEPAGAASGVAFFTTGPTATTPPHPTSGVRVTVYDRSGHVLVKLPG